MEIPDQDDAHDRLVVESVPIATVLVNCEGKIVLVNAQTEKLFGYERYELLGQPVEILVPQSSRGGHAGFRADVLAHAQARVMRAGRDLYARRKDGEQFPMEIGLNPIETGGGTWVMASIVDITERRRAEALVRESEERFRSMTDTAPVMIWGAGPDKLCTFFNHEWLTFTGSTMDEALGNGWSAKVHPDDRDHCYRNYSSSFDARRTFQTECRLRQADGEYRWVLATGTPRFDSSGVFTGYVGSCIDVSEVKRMREDALATQKLESLGQLAGGIAHDFNNLLGGILASAELLLAERAEGSSLEEELQRIRTAAVRGGEIVRQLMTYSGKETLGFEPIDVSSLVGEMLGLLRISISKHAVLKTELREGLPAVYANPAQIRRVVMNLITNASEAIGERDAVIRVTTARVNVVPDARVKGAANLPAGDYIRLEVSDAGSGMTPEVESRIFDPFFTTRSTGRGLGLAAVQGIVRSHQGSINVESSLGHGTRVEVLLPCVARPARDSGDMALPPSGYDAESVAETVLVVEDEDSLRVPVAKMLRRAGFSVIEALDGNVAMDLFRAHAQDIAAVLLDMTLPGMSGPEVFAELRRIQPDVKVILTTAYSQEWAVTAVGGRQGWAFIRKPYQVNDLLNLLRDTHRHGGRKSRHAPG